MKWSAAVRRTSSENLSFITSSTKTVYAIFRVLVLQMRCSSIDDSRGKMEVLGVTVRILRRMRA